MQAEKEYHNKVKHALKDADKYVTDCQRKQSAYLDHLRHEWDLFEKAEREKLEKALLDDQQKLEHGLAKSKEQMRACQQKKAEAISERLKEEVLSLYGS